MNARAQVNSQNGMKLFLQTEPGTIVSLFRRDGCAVGACGDVMGFRYQGTAERIPDELQRELPHELAHDLGDDELDREAGR
jgi:hypothetical protein